MSKLTKLPCGCDCAREWGRECVALYEGEPILIGENALGSSSWAWKVGEVGLEGARARPKGPLECEYAIGGDDDDD